MLVIHVDTHRFVFDQAFNLQRQPVRNVTRLIVPGANEVRGVRVDFGPRGLMAAKLIGLN